MAATVNARPASSESSWVGHQKAYTLTKTINFATTGYALAQNETMAILDIPADTMFLAASFKVTTAQATISDVDLGVSTTGATDDSLIDGATFATTGIKGCAATGIAIFNAAATQLVITNLDAQTLNSAVVKVTVVMVDLS
jgi:hypothetical protein